jgi:hypothetical protein
VLMHRRHSGLPVPRSSFAGFRFPPEVITVAVRWYLRYGLSYRDVEELLAERGIEVDHVTIYRWVHRFTPLLIDAARPCRHAPGDRWFVDETYVKVSGRWVYLYRAIDQFGQVIDVMVSQKRDLAATRRFFTRARCSDSPPPAHTPRPSLSTAALRSSCCPRPGAGAPGTLGSGAPPRRDAAAVDAAAGLGPGGPDHPGPQRGSQRWDSTREKASAHLRHEPPYVMAAGVRGELSLVPGDAHPSNRRPRDHRRDPHTGQPWCTDSRRLLRGKHLERDRTRHRADLAPHQPTQPGPPHGAARPRHDLTCR